MSGEGLNYVTVVGVGLIGGSVGLAVKAACPGATVAGVGRSEASLATARSAGAIDEAYLDAAEPARRSDLILLATPVCAFRGHLETIAPHLPAGAVVTDAGSTKAQVVQLAEEVLGPGGPFVGSHPMAGSEKRGPAAARGDLLRGALCIVTPAASTQPQALARVERFWRMLGMNTLRMSPAIHDSAVARVSHLPHLLAAQLMMLPRPEELTISAGGFRDATRMAAGDVEMWRDILLTNGPAILAAMDEFADGLGRLRELVAGGDATAIETFLTEARRRKLAMPARPLRLE